jgi:predicted phage-related endonuclease
LTSQAEHGEKLAEAMGWRKSRITSDLGDRTSYLGATDIAAIVGVSPWAAPIDVYRAKVEGTDK